MYKVNQITDDPLQSQRLVLPDGTTIALTLYYIQQQLGWFFRSFSYGDFVISGMRITNSPNMLHQYRNLIPFGMACYSKNDREPTQIGDFSSGASVLYVLTAAEVAGYTAFLNGQ